MNVFEEANVRRYTQMYANGSWYDPDGADVIEVIDSTTERSIAQVPNGSPGDVDAAAVSARDALGAWGRLPPHERGRYLEALSQGIRRRADEIAEAITREVGMPLKLSRRIQVELPAMVAEDCATLTYDYAWTERIANSVVEKHPVGVVACITPWNYPLHQVMAKIGPALAAGCTVVVKPSELAPISIFILAEIVHDAGLPRGVFNLVSGYGPCVGEALCSHPDVDMISFTGSGEAGRRVAQIAARSAKKLALELGGKSASIVLDDANLEQALRSTVLSCFLNSGQTCNALTRLIVPEASYDWVRSMVVDLTTRLVVGNPLTEGTRVGPLVSARQRERVQAFIRGGMGEGAKLLHGGADSPVGLETGYFVRPTVFGEVAPDMTIAREEIFGPVLSILSYRHESEAISLANATQYGLSAAIWSGDEVRAKRLGSELRVGQVDINGGPFNRLAPFGGCKASGYGRELGRFGLEEFISPKSFQYPVDAAPGKGSA